MATSQTDHPGIEMGVSPRARGQVTVASGSNLLVGIWLIIAPFALSYSGVGNAMWDDVVIGASIATLAGIRVFGAYRQTWPSWTNAILGAWLVIAPWALNYSSTGSAVANDVVIGLIVFTLASWSAIAGRANANRA